MRSLHEHVHLIRVTRPLLNKGLVHSLAYGTYRPTLIVSKFIAFSVKEVLLLVIIYNYLQTVKLSNRFWVRIIWHWKTSVWNIFNINFFADLRAHINQLLMEVLQIPIDQWRTIRDTYKKLLASLKWCAVLDIFKLSYVCRSSVISRSWICLWRSRSMQGPWLTQQSHL